MVYLFSAVFAIVAFINFFINSEFFLRIVIFGIGDKDTIDKQFFRVSYSIFFLICSILFVLLGITDNNLYLLLIFGIGLLFYIILFIFGKVPS